MRGITAGRWVLFLLFLFSFSLLLRVLDWIPEALQSSRLRHYSSLEEVRRAHPRPRLYLPTFFPMQLEWPPREILAQGRPYFLLLLHIRDRENGRVALAIRQVDAVAEDVPEPRIRLLRIQSEAAVELEGRPALLLLGNCGDGGVCNQVSWEEGRYRLTVVARASAQQLLRIAESMIP